jgi:hypothetical protein
MPAVYDNYGVKFAYPENWTLLEEGTDWPREICVESPGGAQWALHIYQPPGDPQKLVQGAVSALEGEYGEVEAEYLQESLGGAAAEGCDMTFFYLDLLVTCQARCFTWGDKTLLLLTQAEDREFQELEAVFRAMTVSLLQSLEAGPIESV